jgi:hypothetical protein
MNSSLVPKPRPRSKTKDTTLRGRPVWIDKTGDITGEKGTRYSEVTTTIPWGTEWITAPSIDKDGSRLSDEEVKQKLKDNEGRDFITGEKLPTFESEPEATAYAEWRSDTMFDLEEIEKGYPEKVYENVEPEKEENSFMYDMGSYAKGIGKALAAIGLRRYGVDYYPTADGFFKGGDVQKEDPALKFKRRSTVTDQSINDAINAQPKKGMGYVELLVDNIVGLDNEYESFGEKLGTEFNKDELGFLKNIAVGAYEGAKEFVTSPVDTTKSVVKDIADSVQRLGTEDLDMRLKRLYNVTYADATDEQVNRARESVFGDALTALELVPAGAATAVVAKQALKSGAGKQAIDFAKRIEVDPDAVGSLGGNIRLTPKDTSDFDRSQITPVQRKRTDTLPKSEVSPLTKESTDKRLFETGVVDFFYDSDPEYMTVSPEAARESFRKDKEFYTRDFYSSITTALENRVGKKGISGKVAKKFLEKNAPNINKQELYWSGLLDILEDDKVYKRDELLSLAKENTPQVEIEVLTNPRFEVGDPSKRPKFFTMQRITKAIRLKNNDGSLISERPSFEDFDYAEILITNKNKKESFYDGAYEHWGESGVLGHARVTYINHRDKSAAVVDEFQSDAVQGGGIASKQTSERWANIKKDRDDGLPTLGDIGLHYELELFDFVSSYFLGNVPLSKKFKDEIKRYNYDFDSITDQEAAETAIKVGLTDTVKKLTKLKDKHIRNEITYGEVVDELAKEFNLKTSAIKRRSIQEISEIDNAFANVLGDYVFGKSVVRKHDKNNNGEMKEDLASIFSAINVQDFTDHLVPLNLTGSVRTALLGVIKDAKERGINKIIIPPVESLMKVRRGGSKPAFKATYEDAAIKALKELKSETKGKINFERKEDDLISFEAGSDPIIIDVSDFEIPEFAQFRFYKGGDVPKNNWERLTRWIKSKLDEIENPFKKANYDWGPGVVRAFKQMVKIDEQRAKETFPDLYRKHIKGEKLYNKGGVTMKDQMQMAFIDEGGLRDDGMNRDPVSGNEVPSGSLAEEVRDDVPARLSEGEYVVPADVVRFYGVKFFEDLRTKAKMGLQDMEQNGRIGGTPINEPTPARSMDEDLSSEEFEFLQSLVGDERNLDAMSQEMTSQATALSEGGEVRGYYDSSMVTNPYQQPYVPAYATPGAMTVGMNAPYIYPGSGGTPGYGPPQAPQEPPGGCPEGMMWNGTMCVIDPNYVAPQRGGGGSDDDGPGTTAPEPKPWYEGIDVSDPSGYLDGLLGAQQEDQSMIGGILSNMPIFKAVGSIGHLSNVAKARATVAMAKVTEVNGKAKYSDEEISAMEAKIDKYIDDNNVNRKIADSIASGRMFTTSGMGNFDKNKDGKLDFLEELGGNIKEKQPTKPKPEYIDTSKLKGVSTSTTFKKDGDTGTETDALRRQRSDESKSNLEKMMADTRKRADAIKAESKKTGKSIAEIGRASAPSSASKTAKQKAKEEGDPRGMDKGGLMSKKKKK